MRTKAESFASTAQCPVELYASQLQSLPGLWHGTKSLCDHSPRFEEPYLFSSFEPKIQHGCTRPDLLLAQKGFILINSAEKANLQQPSCWNSTLNQLLPFPLILSINSLSACPSLCPDSDWEQLCSFGYWSLCPVCKRLKSAGLVFPFSFPTATFNHSQRKGASQARRSDWAE